jgi:integrase
LTWIGRQWLHRSSVSHKVVSYDIVVNGTPKLRDNCLKNCEIADHLNERLFSKNLRSYIIGSYTDLEDNDERERKRPYPNRPTDWQPLQKSDLARAGESANRAAADYLFADYRQRRAKKTLRTQTAALLLWVQYLAEVGAAGGILHEARVWALSHFDPDTLAGLAEYAQSQQTPLPIIYAAHYCQQRPAAWQGVTWGLVEGFVKWLLNQGYSLASVNNRLSAVKVYARLAAKAGVIPPTPQGIRDQLLIGLLLDLGLRASEVAALTVEDLAEPGYLTVYRQKTDTTDRMALTADYETYMRQSGTLLRGSRKNGELTKQVMSVRAIGGRVKILGRDILGLWELSPHDLRHTWATRAAKESNPFVLRDAGGWTNMQTPGRYVERAQVINEGIRLDY